LATYIAENLQYPAEAEANGEQGRSIVQFVVNIDGSICQERIVRSSGSKSLDAEALRVTKAAPQWIPAQLAGENVRSYYTLPITFKLDTIKPTDAEVSKDEEHADDSSLVVENMPEYPGGVQAMMQFLSDNIKYPKDAQEKAIEGRVICQFIVEKDGSIVEVTIASSSGNASLDKEAIRVIQSMPKWKPGKQRGKPVRVKYTVPVNFRLQ
jgi:TonB family protein